MGFVCAAAACSLHVCRPDVAGSYGLHCASHAPPSDVRGMRPLLLHAHCVEPHYLAHYA
jgi:hypothetical protein